MAMTECMADVHYDHHDFLFDPRSHRHPLEQTEKHYQYQLLRGNYGKLEYQKGQNGNKVRSPRCLRDMCMYYLACNVEPLHDVPPDQLPSNFHPTLMMEGIFQRQANSVTWAVSTWPMKVLRVYDMLPLEDFLEDNYMTMPLEDNGHTTLSDCFIMGLLKRSRDSGLRYIDFRRFENDRRLCKELCRLPILWMKPENRTLETVHDIMSDIIDVDKDKVQRFLNRIGAVYEDIDSDFNHEINMDPITVMLDLKILIDDVPLGLSLQHNTPFKFASNHVWMKPIQDVSLTPCNLGKVIDSACITHLAFQDPNISNSSSKFQQLLEALKLLSNLHALSLPKVIDVDSSPGSAKELCKVLQRLKQLERLDLSHCNLQSQLESLLDKLPQCFSYLNLRDCRLTEQDLFFLARWRGLPMIRELNLSSNNLSPLDQVLVAMLERMPRLTCFSLSHCNLTVHSQALIVKELREGTPLKVLHMQTYVPLPVNDLLELLYIAAQMSQLQKVLLLPDSYAFPGNTMLDREENKIYLLLCSYRYLEARGRPDIELE